METIAIEAVQWLNSEIDRLMKERFASQPNIQNELAPQIVKQEERKKTLEATLATAKDNLAKIIENAKAMQSETDKNVQAARNELAEKQKSYEMLQDTQKALGNQLAEAKRPLYPILREIETLKADIEQLTDEINEKKRRVDQTMEIPNEIKKLRERKEKALALKPGFLQKTAIAEELLHESVSLKDSIGTSKLDEYKQLCTELQSMCFDEQEMGDEQ